MTSSPSLEAILSPPYSQPLWIFGYGSLVWRPAFSYSNMCVIYLPIQYSQPGSLTHLVFLWIDGTLQEVWIHQRLQETILASTSAFWRIAFVTALNRCLTIDYDLL